MADIFLAKEYLRARGVSNVDDMDHDDVMDMYENQVKAGLDYYNRMIREDNPEIIGEAELDIKSVLDDTRTVDQLYDVLYKLLRIYPTKDVIAIIAGGKIPVSYKKLNQIVSLAYAKVQDETLDKIAMAVECLPEYERETLMFYYEQNREDVMMLEQCHAQYSKQKMLEQARKTANAKLQVMQAHMKHNMEREYKPYFDNTKEKKQLISNIMSMTSSHMKDALFNMTTHELNHLYAQIKDHNRQKEKATKLLRQYIEIFDETNSMSDSELKSHVGKAMEELNESAMTELIMHFEHNNYMIASKISNIVKANS